MEAKRDRVYCATETKQGLLAYYIVVRLDGLLVQGRNLPVTADRDVPEHAIDPDPDGPPIQTIVNYQNSGRADAEMLMLHVRREAYSGGVGLAYTLFDEDNVRIGARNGARGANFNLS